MFLKTKLRPSSHGRIGSKPHTIARKEQFPETGLAGEVGIALQRVAELRIDDVT
jgi:hypothetical protein